MHMRLNFYKNLFWVYEFKKSRLNSVFFRNVTHSNILESKYNRQFYPRYKSQT